MKICYVNFMQVFSVRIRTPALMRLKRNQEKQEKTFERLKVQNPAWGK